MSTIQIESLWQYIQTLSLSKRNKKWLADKLIENIGNEAQQQTNATTLAAINEAKEGKLVSYDSLEDFKSHMYEL